MKNWSRHDSGTTIGKSGVKIKKCPFSLCASKEVEVIVSTDGYAVRCFACGCKGPVSSGTLAAVASWNKRGSSNKRDVWWRKVVQFFRDPSWNYGKGN